VQQELHQQLRDLLVQLVLKEQTSTLLGLLQTLAHCLLVRQTTMLILLMLMETYTFGAEVLGLMQVKLLGRKDLLDLLVQQALLQGPLDQLDLLELLVQLVLRVQLALLVQPVQLEQLLFGTLLVPITAEHHTQLVI
jgi:hypothetical protein